MVASVSVSVRSSTQRSNRWRTVSGLEVARATTHTSVEAITPRTKISCPAGKPALTTLTSASLRM